MKTPNTTRFDAISSQTLNMLTEISAICMTHAINCKIRTLRFSKALKITRILLITNQKKIKNHEESQRPIGNIHTFEKVIKQYLNEEIMEFLEENEVILGHHHGGISGHSTLTAKFILDYLASKAQYQNKLAIIVSSDLSFAFNLVLHEI